MKTSCLHRTCMQTCSDHLGYVFLCSTGTLLTFQTLIGIPAVPVSHSTRPSSPPVHPVCPSVYPVTLCIHPSVHLFFCSSVHPSFCPFMHTNLHPSTRLSIRLAVYPSIFFSNCIAKHSSTYLSIFPFVYLFFFPANCSSVHPCVHPVQSSGLFIYILLSIHQSRRGISPPVYPSTL